MVEAVKNDTKHSNNNKQVVENKDETAHVGTEVTASQTTTASDVEAATGQESADPKSQDGAVNLAELPDSASSNAPVAITADVSTDTAAFHNGV